MEKKGTVTQLSSIFPAEEAQRASQRVQDVIEERQQQLQQLNEFIKDNNNLINLVHKLPDELHHELMVPFGKAAFFPGRLIHTNECMVLLGEGYYAQRTTKQTTDILKRRGKALDSQVESLKAVMDDLKLEASFFNATASEASENLVDIREEYVEKDDLGPPTRTGPETSSSIGIEVHEKTPAADEDDKENARIWSIMDALEKEEQEAEGTSEPDNDEVEQEAEESPKSDEDELIQSELISNISQMSVSQAVTSSKVKASEAQLKVKDVSPPEDTPKPKGSTRNDLLVPPKAKVEVQSTMMDSNPAFTNTIIERNPNNESNSKPVSSRPVSRFKMMQRKQ